MSKTKHTPGPWKIHAAENMGEHPNHRFRFVGTADFDEEAGLGEIVCKLTDSPAIVANARLIAAAPDLLAACEAAVQAIWLERSLNPNFPKAWSHIDAQLVSAIAKAKGTTCKFCEVQIRSGDECPDCYRARCDDDAAQRAAQERMDAETED